MHRRPLPLTLTLLLALMGTTFAAPSDALANSFRVECASSHVANDDPIVYPGRPGAAHRHEFFGARSADAASTTASLERSATSCASRSDTAAYWVPTLEVRSTLVHGAMTVYYQRAGKRQAAAPPRGLRMIAGDLHSTTPQSMRVTSWQCVGRGRMTQSNVVPACRNGERLGAWVRFPDCWDGRHLDSANHRSHMAYASVGGATPHTVCPSSHPVAIMRVATLVTWPVRPQSPTIVRLADDMLDPTGMHGDFWNAWRMPTLRQLRWDCIEVAAPCGAITR
ncbi:MAG: putative secreted protein [Thermoleophilia bacterium]|nr:putative secreted protein [Thermoleophilia bacterium]